MRNQNTQHRIESLVVEMEAELFTSEYDIILMLLFHLLNDKDSLEKVIHKLSARETT
jgi:hypothetical protein